MLRWTRTYVLKRTKKSVMVITGTPLLNDEKQRLLIENGVGKKQQS